jgi:hypothetical protein
MWQMGAAAQARALEIDVVEEAGVYRQRLVCLKAHVFVAGHAHAVVFKGKNIYRVAVDVVAVEAVGGTLGEVGALLELIDDGGVAGLAGVVRGLEAEVRRVVDECTATPAVANVESARPVAAFAGETEKGVDILSQSRRVGRETAIVTGEADVVADLADGALLATCNAGAGEEHHGQGGSQRGKRRQLVPDVADWPGVPGARAALAHGQTPLRAISCLCRQCLVRRASPSGARQSLR